MKAWFTLTAGGMGQGWPKALAITRWRPIKETSSRTRVKPQKEIGGAVPRLV